MTTLLTGATGTFGTHYLTAHPQDIRAYSRDEHKQAELAPRFPDVRWLVGDIRDLPRLRRAMEGCDVVIHAAALKHVTSCEHNPWEALKTNAVGTMNVVEACLDAGVSKAVFISSDKAVHPTNVYGASKMVGEKCWLASNGYGGNRCAFTVVRYGNVRGSRGSVHTKGKVQLTDSRATRFWMQPEQAVELVDLALATMLGGEIYIPKLESSLVKAEIDHDGTETGLKPGEKLHEQLISDEETPFTYDFGHHYRVIRAGNPIVRNGDPAPESVPPDFRYSSAV